MKLIMRGVDCWGYPSGAEVKAAGLHAVNGYLTGATAITREVLADYTANDIYVWLTFEESATAPEGGAAQAQVDAESALGAVHALRLPVTAGVAIYGTNDSVVTDWNAVVAYFVRWSGLIANAGYEPGVYANSTVTDYLRARGVRVTRYWQTGAGSPNGPVPYAHIYQGAPDDQYGFPQLQAFGRTCDSDGIFSPNFGGVNLHGLWQAPIVNTEEEMPLFLAKSFDGPATLLYDIQAQTCRGVSLPESTLYEKVGIKNYGATLDNAVLSTFKRVG